MAEYSTSEMKSGVKVMIEGDPCNILENEFVKPGKGQAFNRVKYRNLKTGRVLERTFKSGDVLPAADVTDIEVIYLYNDGEFSHFMHPETFEQYSTNKEVVGEAQKWLKEQDHCFLTIWNDVPIGITTQIFVVLRVTETEPGLKGDTVSGATKPATLETSATVRVPLFVEIGDLLKIDTRTGAYVSRMKE